MLADLLLSTQSSIDVSVPGQTQGQLIIGLVFTAAITIALLVAYRRSEFAGLPREQAAHKSTLLGNLRDQTPETVYIGPDDAVDGYRSDISAAFERVEQRVRGEDADHNPDQTSLREGVGVLLGTLREETVARLPDVPRLALRLGSLAITVLVLGFLAVSTELLVRALLVDAGIPSSSSALADAIAATQTFVDGAIEILALFPGADLLFGLALAFGIALAEFLYAQYYIVAAALIGCAMLLAGLDRLVPDSLDRKAFQHDRRLSTQSLGVLAALWAAGVLPSAVGRLVGERAVFTYTVDFATVGTAVGVIAVAIVALVALYRAVIALLRRVWLTAGLAVGGEPLPILAYLLARYLAVGVALIAAPLIPVYLGVILVGGALLDIAGGLVAADPIIQLVIVGLFVVGWLLLGRLVPEAQRDLRTALSEATARNAVRAAVFQRALVIGVVLLGGSVLLSLLGSVPLAAAGGLLLGAVVWVGLALLDRATFRARMLDSDAVRKGVLIRCYWVQDADGDRHRVAIVERGRREHRLSNADHEELFEDIDFVATRLQTGDEVPMTVSERGGQDRLEDGFVDGKSGDRLREEIRKTIRTAFGEQQRASVRELSRACDGYRDELWQQAVERHLRTGVVSVRRIDGGDLWADDDAVLTLDRDVWSPGVQRPDTTAWTEAA